VRGRWAAARALLLQTTTHARKDVQQNGSWSPARDRDSKVFAVKAASRRSSATRTFGRLLLTSERSVSRAMNVRGARKGDRLSCAVLGFGIETSELAWLPWVMPWACSRVFVSLSASLACLTTGLVRLIAPDVPLVERCPSARSPASVAPLRAAQSQADHPLPTPVQSHATAAGRFTCAGSAATGERHGSTCYVRRGPLVRTVHYRPVVNLPRRRAGLRRTASSASRLVTRGRHTSPITHAQARVARALGELTRRCCCASMEACFTRPRCLRVDLRDA